MANLIDITELPGRVVDAILAVRAEADFDWAALSHKDLCLVENATGADLSLWKADVARADHRWGQNMLEAGRIEDRIHAAFDRDETRWT